MRSFKYFIYISLITTSVYSQGWKPEPNDTLVSPRIYPDNRVKFSIYAPAASEATVTGDWRPTWGIENLAKDSLGVWSFTTEPLKPDFYSYTLTVDRVRTFDPKNTESKPGVSGMENMFEVPGTENEYQNNNNVPHGDIRSVWYYSSSMAQQRRMHIYTPPGYDQNDDKYPVLYLQHGSGDDDLGWSTVGRAGFILDNLIAAGKAEPMLVIMADGTRTRPRRIQGQSYESMMAEDKFGKDLFNDIIPHVESKYRVIADRNNRAFAGLSMGALQVLWFGLPNFDQFAYFGIFSMGITPEALETYEKTAEPFLRNSDKTNEDIKLLWIASGKNDLLIQGVHNLVKFFEAKNIDHVYKETEGGHTWLNWRRYLRDFASLLFK